jgi:hypothetical protein
MRKADIEHSPAMIEVMNRIKYAFGHGPLARKIQENISPITVERVRPTTDISRLERKRQIVRMAHTENVFNAYVSSLCIHCVTAGRHHCPSVKAQRESRLQRSASSSITWRRRAAAGGLGACRGVLCVDGELVVIGSRRRCRRLRRLCCCATLQLVMSPSGGAAAGAGQQAEELQQVLGQQE